MYKWYNKGATSESSQVFFTRNCIRKHTYFSSLAFYIFSFEKGFHQYSLGIINSKYRPIFSVEAGLEKKTKHNNTM